MATFVQTLHDGFLWHRRWCHLQDGEIHCWKDPKEVEKQDPLEMISLKDLDGDGSVSLARREECARQHVFVLSSTVSSNRRLFGTDSKEECLQWMGIIGELFDSLAVWRSVLAG
jgi:hypothetical protein